MTTTMLVPAALVFCVTTFGGQLLTKDAATTLPLIPATDSGNHFGSGPYNTPTKMPDGHVCKSTMQANFYSLFKIKMDAATAWYDTHLTGFKKVSGYGYGRPEVAYYNSDGTLVVILTGDRGAKGENTDAYSVAYQRYAPGLSEKTVTSLTQEKILCQ